MEIEIKKRYLVIGIFFGCFCFIALSMVGIFSGDGIFGIKAGAILGISCLIIGLQLYGITYLFTKLMKQEY